MNEEIILCPTCGTENGALNQTCLSCGRSLIIVCPRCYTVSAITAEQCPACDQRFDMLGQIMARQEIRKSDRFTRQAANAIEIKQTEQAQDQARSNQLWEIERQRQAALMAQKREQQRQEKLLMIGATVAAVVLIAIVLISAAAR